MVLKKIVAIIFVLIALISVFREYFVLVILGILALIILWYVIRFIADLYWWGKDKGKW